MQKGYNSNVIGVENNLKQYQGQEFTEDLGLNTHQWKYRISDPAIGRFWQIDPLAEDFTYNSPYAFQENKLGIGIELEGLEVERQRGGLQDMLGGYGSYIREKTNIPRQMDKRGFSGDERAETATMESQQERSRAAGQIAQGGEDFTKGSIHLVGEAAELGGEWGEDIGIATCQPELTAAGEAMNTFGVILQGAVDISDGKDVTETAVGVVASAALGELGDQTIKAAKKAAGGNLNKVSESIIQGSFKAYELITEKLIVPKIAPVIGPVEDSNN